MDCGWTFEAMMIIPYIDLEKKLEGVSQSVQIGINRTAETARDLLAYVYYIQDAQL